ncbi:MAG: 4-alpha-glucanotransferase, partial [Candidatus Omnitrophica bacterium]|nr:4-alpha-glucanotransferase [Candidatus Omnitrophota bacterium]
MPQFKEPALSLVKKRAGVLIPLFSVYSKNSFAIADFSDLKLVIDWLRVTGNSILQFLPMNEMGQVFCPYDSLSSFALEPLYISLLDLPLPKGKSLKRQIENLKVNLADSKSYTDYTVKEEKIRLLWEIFLISDYAQSADFKNFREENSYWLADFSLYKVLKSLNKNTAWYDWEDSFKNRDKDALKKIQGEYPQEIKFQEWLQWQLYEQFKGIKEYAKTKKVFLKGDLPILVSRDSADVWAYPEFFRLEFSAGAPPDMYCAKGQRWGAPTYNWDRIASEGYRYLKEKLKFSQNFYDILRIDHVVGLFRIWSIPYNEPLENQGLNGFFDPADQALWLEHGREILRVMQENTKMFLCAEDLGVIPQVCTDILKEFGIPGNDVQRWAKDWKIKHDFLKPQDFRRLSVAMLSTHDTTNWPAWWENEAGTVDQALFIRKCSDHRQINFITVKDKLFDPVCSKYGRLRWQESIDSVEKLVKGLSPQGTLPKEYLADFIDLYENSFREKEKLWKDFGLSGPMREKCDKEIMLVALKLSLDTNSLFCINTIFDWLYIAGLLPGDPYQYRINTPGTVSSKNWSLKIPLSLEELLKHKVNKEIRSMITASGRI